MRPSKLAHRDPGRTIRHSGDTEIDAVRRPATAQMSESAGKPARRPPPGAGR